MQFIRSCRSRLGTAACILVCLAGTALMASADVFEDRFEGSTLRPEWSASIPKAGATITVNNGLEMAVGEGPYDYWVGVANQPSVNLPAPDGDWVVSAQIRSADYPDGGGPMEGNYQAVLSVAFGDYDFYIWGVAMNNQRLALQRAGSGEEFYDFDGVPVWVQIRKEGNNYHFYYKTQESDPWVEATTADGTPNVKTVALKPLRIGLLVKTWGAGNPLVANFGSFRLEAPSIRFYGNITGKVTASGSSPSKVAVQALDPDGVVAATTTVADDGTYSLRVSPGTYTVKLVSDSLESPPADTVKTGVKVDPNKTATADFTVQLLPDLDPATAEVFQDDFAGTTLKPEWRSVIPKAGATITVNNGLSIFTPDGTTYDWWTFANQAPRAVVPAPRGDFAVSAQVRSSEDPSGTHPEGPAYQAGVVVVYGDLDFLIFCTHRSGANLIIQRAGDDESLQFPVAGLPVWLQIRRTGNAYTFFYKEQAADAWTQIKDANGNPVTKTLAATPVTVGLTGKTWGTDLAVTSTFTDFRLEAVKLRRYASVVGKVTATSGSAAKLRVEAVDADGIVRATSPVAADGTYRLEVVSGTYSVRVNGNALQTPLADATRAGVAVPGPDPVTVDFTVAVWPDLNPATDEVFEDKFEGTTLKPQWLVANPAADATVAVNDGLVMSMTDASAHDYWVGVDNCPKVLLPAPEGDFIASAQLRSGNDPTGAALDNQNFQVALAVLFGPNDFQILSLHRSNANLIIQRAGGDESAQMPTGGAPLWVQMRKVGDEYRFFYKEGESAAWSPVVDGNGDPFVRSIPNKPVAVGLLAKTWANVPLVASFGDFRLEAVKLRYYGGLSGKVTPSAGSPLGFQIRLLDTNGAVVATTPVAADGTYALTVGSGTYTLRLSGDPGGTVVRSNVVVEPDRTTTLDLNLLAPVGVRGDVNADGKFDLRDILTALKGVAGLEPLTDAQKSAANVTGSGKFGIADVVMMLRKLAGLIPDFPVAA